MICENENYEVYIVPQIVIYTVFIVTVNYPR